jgi:hypothetical protein
VPAGTRPAPAAAPRATAASKPAAEEEDVPF